MRLAAAVLAVMVSITANAPARAADPFAWTPSGSPAIARGREAAARFGLAALTEITVEVDDAFSAASREGLAVAEQRIAAVPGVRRVIGPAGLVEVSLDAAGKPSARSVLGRSGSDAPSGGGAAGEGEGEAARQRVVRRADALGWFFAPSGRLVRFYVDTDDFARVRPGVEAALVASGMGLARSPSGEAATAEALLPDPRARGAAWLPAATAAACVLAMMLLAARTGVAPFARWGVAGAAGAAPGTPGATPAPAAPVGRGRSNVPARRAAHGGRARAAAMLAAAVGAAALFAPARVAGLRAAGSRAAMASAVVLGCWLAVEQVAGWGRHDWRRAAAPPLAVALLAVAVVLAAAVLARGARVGTDLWGRAPLAFVSVRGDLDEPVVLREVRRLGDFLRAQPGVGNAWSVADFFADLEIAGEEASRIPDDAAAVRRVLSQARTDPAVALELAPDHREALVGVRFDDGDSPADRLDLIERLRRYAATDLRRSLVRVDLRAPELPPVPRAVARGLLAVDAHERVRRISARSGRSLSATESLAALQAARQAATIPAADEARLQAELAAEARDGVRELVAQRVPMHPAQRDALARELATLPAEAGDADVRASVAAATGGRLAPAALVDASDALRSRLGAVRRRHTARINFKEMLYGADLPSEGVLADEVRGATLEAMGPVVGLPAPASAPGAFEIDAVAVGGAANDRALSDAWGAALVPGLAAAAAVLAALLLIVGGPRAVGWLPVALAPPAAALLPSALLGEPLGLPSLSFLAGALAAGAAAAVLLAAGRRA